MSLVFSVWHLLSFWNVCWYSCQYFRFANKAKWFICFCKNCQEPANNKLKGTDQNFEIHSKVPQIEKNIMENSAKIQGVPKTIEKEIES